MGEDERIYQEYLRGTEKAVDVLVEKYADGLVLYLHGYVQDNEDAEDLMIEAFARLFARERPIYEAGSFKSYLYKIARNLAIRFHRRQSLPHLSLEALPFDPPSEVLAETELLQDERHRQLYHAMAGLKEEYREALYLVYFEDMSYQSAGRVMGKSEKQVTKLVYHGKQNLRTLLEKEGFTYAENR